MLLSEDKKKEYQEQRYNWRREVKKKLVEHFGSSCSLCGIKGHPCIYDFHHIDPTIKEGQVCGKGGFDLCLKEAEKCIMVCVICHRLIHVGEIKL